MRRLELTHAKTAPFTLGGTNDFDSFMKAVDKSVNKSVKVERRSQKSRAGSRPGSRAASLEETRRESNDEAREERKGGWERLPNRSGRYIMFPPCISFCMYHLPKRHMMVVHFSIFWTTVSELHKLPYHSFSVTSQWLNPPALAFFLFFFITKKYNFFLIFFSDCAI
jgi:hypothetical protein